MCFQFGYGGGGGGGIQKDVHFRNFPVLVQYDTVASHKQKGIVSNGY